MNANGNEGTLFIEHKQGHYEEFHTNLNESYIVLQLFKWDIDR